MVVAGERHDVMFVGDMMKQPRVASIAVIRAARVGMVLDTTDVAGFMTLRLNMRV